MNQTMTSVLQLFCIFSPHLPPFPGALGIGHKSTSMRGSFARSPFLFISFFFFLASFAECECHNEQSIVARRPLRVVQTSLLSQLYRGPGSFVTTGERMTKEQFRECAALRSDWLGLHGSYLSCVVCKIKIFKIEGL